jgi:hypothetical protein
MRVVDKRVGEEQKGRKNIRGIFDGRWAGLFSYTLAGVRNCWTRAASSSDWVTV